MMSKDDWRYKGKTHNDGSTINCDLCGQRVPVRADGGFVDHYVEGKRGVKKYKFICTRSASQAKGGNNGR